MNRLNDRWQKPIHYPFQIDEIQGQWRLTTQDGDELWFASYCDASNFIQSRGIYL